MNKDLLVAMLSDLDGASEAAGEWRLEGDVDALLAVQGGAPTPLRRVQTVKLGDAFASITTEDAVWRLPYAALIGLRTHVKTKSSSRTGFAT